MFSDNKRIRIFTILLFVFTMLILIPYTFSKYASTINKKIVLNVNPATYTVVFHSNDSSDLTTTQSFTYNVSQNLDSNTFTNGTMKFLCWNTKADGSGEDYSNNQSVNNLVDTDGAVFDLYAQWVDGIAIVDGVVYTTLQGAIDIIPTNNTEKTVKLLANTKENISVVANKNIILDLGGNTLSNNGNKPALESYGTMHIINGTITSDAPTNGAINNRNGANMIVDGIRVEVTGNRQAIYNDNAKVDIIGGAYLYSQSTERAAAQNLANSTMNIISATIISTGSHAVQNAGNMNIGVKDDDPNVDSILIRGASYGVNATAKFNYYDGTILGHTKAINNENQILDKEDGYSVVHSDETISGILYDKVILDNGYTITFNGNGGSVSGPMKIVGIGNPVGTLPVATRVNYIFLGWFTDKTNGEKINENKVFDGDTTLYAHWTPEDTEVAKIGDKVYDSLPDAIAAVRNNTDTTITLLKDEKTAISIGEFKQVTIDLNGHTLSSVSGGSALIENNGKLTITNGNLKSNNDASTINNKNGYLVIEDTSIIATGTRQTVYITGGTVEVKGDSYLESSTTGVTTDTGADRATLQALPDTTLIVRSGTIIGKVQNAIGNEGTLIVGDDDGNINSTSPLIIGYMNGISNAADFSYYDGIVKGINNAIDGNITNMANNATIINGTEVIDGNTYKVKYLNRNN